MSRLILPSGLSKLYVPGFDLAPHIQEMEAQFLRLARGEIRRLIVAIPIRHGKSSYANSFIAWLLISKPTLRILRVMDSAATCEMEANHVLEMVERDGLSP